MALRHGYDANANAETEADADDNTNGIRIKRVWPFHL